MRGKKKPNRSREKRQLRREMEKDWQEYLQAMEVVMEFEREEFFDSVDFYEEFDPDMVRALSEPDWGLALEIRRGAAAVAAARVAG